MDGAGDALTVRLTSPSEQDLFFSKSKLSLQKWIHVVHLWSISMPVTTACKEAGVASKTAIDGYQWLREVCSTKLLATPIKLGSPGTVVQADESLNQR